MNNNNQSRGESAVGAFMALMVVIFVIVTFVYACTAPVDAQTRSQFEYEIPVSQIDQFGGWTYRTVVGDNTAFIGAGTQIVVVDKLVASSAILSTVSREDHYIRDFEVVGSTLYVAYDDGSQVYDFTDPKRPTEPHEGWPYGKGKFEVAGSTAFVTGTEIGLRAFGLGPDRIGNEVGFVLPGITGFDVALYKNRAYVATRDSIEIVDITDTTQMKKIGQISQFSAFRLKVSGDYLLAIGNYRPIPGNFLQVYDLTGNDPKLVKTITKNVEDAVVGKNNKLFVANHEGLEIWDLEKETGPEETEEGYFYGVTLLNMGEYELVYASDVYIGLKLYQTALGSMQLANNLLLPGQVEEVLPVGDFTYISGWNTGLTVIDKNSTVTTRLNVFQPGKMARHGSTLYVASLAGLQEFDISEPAR